MTNPHLLTTPQEDGHSPGIETPPVDGHLTFVLDLDVGLAVIFHLVVLIGIEKDAVIFEIQQL